MKDSNLYKKFGGLLRASFKRKEEKCITIEVWFGGKDGENNEVETHVL